MGQIIFQINYCGVNKSFIVPTSNKNQDSLPGGADSRKFEFLCVLSNDLQILIEYNYDVWAKSNLNGLL